MSWYNIITLLVKYDDSVFSILTLSENSLWEDSELYFLSNQFWVFKS